MNAQGEQLVKSGREYRWKKHDSVTISGNRWYRHSQSKGGYPVDFVMEFYYATFPEAVKILIGEEGEGRQKFCPAPSQDFRLPEKNEDNEIIIKYLTEKREIEKKLVEEWIDRGDIYEEKKHHNVIFVGRDADGIPRYAHCRGTGEIKYRGDVAESDKSCGFSHRGTDNQLFVFEAAIDLLSFIQLFPKDWNKRSYLSLGGISGVALMAFLSERPQITSVFLCLDNDQPGNEACEKLAEEIPDGYSVIRLKPSRKDWNEILCDKSADRKKAIIETVTMKAPEELVPMLCYEDIEQTSVEWLWFPYLPFGKLTIIQGNPGEGKTYFAMMLTAACTNRKTFPNMEEIEPFNVIYQTAEDGMGDTIKPRLVEAGADLSRVMVIDDTEEALTLSDDRIEKAIRQNQVRLLIIDPVQAFIGADVDMNRANEVRPVFRKLGMIAEKTGCAIVLIGHLNKSSGTQSTYRGLGSIDIMAAVRSLLFIGKVKKDPTTRVLIHEKSSLAPPGETMAFKLGDEEGFRWVGAYEISADDLLDGKEGKPTETKLQRGTKLIYELLADGNAVTIRELDEKAKAQGISQRTMREARSRMKEELDYRMNEKQENTIRLKKQGRMGDGRILE
ncbi:MAG: AAA family ATPase [Blautia wexlerae]